MSLLAASNIALPLDEDQTRKLHHAVSGLTSAQLHWVSGYVAGLAVADAEPPEPNAEADNTLTILYGSQTGNGEGIGVALAQQAREKGFDTNLTSLADYKPANLKREMLVTFVISTHGEGDPPDDAELFHEFILSSKAPQLPNLRYSVMALGDSSYIKFCQTGRELDARLAELGAQRLLPMVECDVDYDDPAAKWSNDVVSILPELLNAGVAVPHLRAVETAIKYDKQRPFSAEILLNQKITGADSSKDVRHIELSLEGSGLTYEPGDALAVIVENPPQLIEQFLDVLGLDRDAPITVQDVETTLEDVLRRKLEITAPSLGFLRTWAELSGAAELQAMLEPEGQSELSDFVESHQIIDIVRKYPAGTDAASFAASLRKLSPRSYSIASSLRVNPDEVHLTVAPIHYEAHGSEHWGAASTHLADRLVEGDRVSVYVEPNTRFRLPADNNTPIIMIGPGTGVAPFRAFIEERGERGAKGASWLFFGERNFASDFLYQLEWQRHLKNGRLHRLDVAFSRDQSDKVYVQNRIVENGADVYEWIESGAILYVCGDARNMAADVHAALVEVIAAHGGLSHADAETRLKEMRRAGRYQRDVY